MQNVGLAIGRWSSWPRSSGGWSRSGSCARSVSSMPWCGHGSAAAVWDLGPWPTRTFDVTVPRHRRVQEGISVHRAQVGRVLRDGYPVTTVERTLVDLAAELSLGRLRDAFERAERLELLDVRGVHEEMPGRRGARKIRTILAEWADPEPAGGQSPDALPRLRHPPTQPERDAVRLRGGCVLGGGRARGRARPGRRRDQIGMSQSGRSRPSSCSSGSSSAICALSLNSRSESRFCFPVGTNG